jgi:hypothetical protein
MQDRHASMMYFSIFFWHGIFPSVMPLPGVAGLTARNIQVVGRNTQAYKKEVHPSCHSNMPLQSRMLLSSTIQVMLCNQCCKRNAVGTDSTQYELERL